MKKPIAGIVALLVLIAAFGVWRVFLRPRGAGFGPVEPAQQIARNLYLIPGAGGNVAVYIAAGGVVLVDTKVADQGPAIVAEVAKISERPITQVINTHSHGDHTGSNLFFGATAGITAHENTAAAMKGMSNFLFGWRKLGLPNRTYSDRLSILSDADAIDLYHFGPAHTDGDTFVVFRAARVLHAGDVFPFKGVPSMNDRQPLEYVQTLRKAAASIQNVDQVITGHRGVVPWREFEDFVEFVGAITDRAVAAHRQGRTADAAASSLDLPARFRDYDLTNLRAAIGLMFAQLSH